MQKALLVLLSGLSLTACQQDQDVQPADVQSDFGVDFALRYQQQALLPTRQQPELTVAVQELLYTHCPKAVTCIVGTGAQPTLAVTDAQGQVQQVRWPANQPRIDSPDWLDTTSVRANGRRYLLTYRRWELDDLGDRVSAEKKDFTIWLRVDKPLK